jgi:hypothetical protein
MIEAQPRFDTISLVALALILALGIFWRISSRGSTRAAAPLRPLIEQIEQARVGAER